MSKNVNGSPLSSTIIIREKSPKYLQLSRLSKNSIDRVKHGRRVVFKLKTTKIIIKMIYVFSLYHFVSQNIVGDTLVRKSVLTTSTTQFTYLLI